MAGVVLANLGKRGRESSAEQWRELARTVPGTLLRVATTESEAIRTIVTSVCRWLPSHTVADWRREICRAFQRGNSYYHCVIKRLAALAALHDGAGHFFALCAARLGLTTERGDGRDDEAQALWRAWEGHHAEAAHHAGEVQQRLRSAIAHLNAAFCVIYVFYRRPRESPLRVEWVLETRRLLSRAAREVTAGRDAVLRMRHAVFLEFFDAWMVLSRLDARGCA